MANVPPTDAGVRFSVEADNSNCVQFPATVKEEEQSAPMETAPEVGSASEALEAQFQFLKAPSLDELGSLSTAIHTFQCCLNELQNHLHSIHNAIGTLEKRRLSSSPSLNDQQINHRQSQSVGDAKFTSALNSSSSHLQPGSSNRETGGNGGKTDGKNSRGKQSPSPSLSELENICETMNSRGLRKYIVSHLSDIANVRHQIILALKRAPKPAKLVFDCIGRFYLQGRKAYCKNSPMIPARQASVLILEFFLLSGAGETANDKKIEIEPSLKVEADLAAIAWRKRVITEGGLRQADDTDAGGLLLFLASFGIPAVFTKNDLRDLLISSNLKGISDALRRSHVLLTRIPDIIKGMTKNSMNTEAVNVVFAFGLEDEFPPQEILSSFLRECDEKWKRKISELRGSTMKLIQENEKKLASLKSVLKCLEDNKMDPVEHLPEWKIQEMIINLQKDIAALGKKMKEKALKKRKTDEISSQSYQNQEVKRSRPLQQSSISYNSSMPTKLLESGLPAQLNNYQIPSIHGSSLQFLSENGSGCVSLGQTAVHAAAGVGTTLLTETSVPRGPFRSHQRAMGVENNEDLIYKMGSAHELHASHAASDVSLKHKLMAQSCFIQQAAPAVEPDGIHRLSLPTEGFAGMPRRASSNGLERSKPRDLYHFADAVFDSQSPKAATPGAALTRLRQSHQSPYF